MMMAMDANKLIGANGGLPWHIPGELAYFKSVTMGKPVIMGRKTFESIGKPLPGRANVVVTSNTSWQRDGVHTEIMIIGGAALCRELMPVTERLYLTYIDKAFEGDTWLDSFHWREWTEVSRETRDPNDTNGIAVSYLVLERQV